MKMRTLILAVVLAVGGCSGGVVDTTSFKASITTPVVTTLEAHDQDTYVAVFEDGSDTDPGEMTEYSRGALAVGYRRQPRSLGGRTFVYVSTNHGKTHCEATITGMTEHNVTFDDACGKGSLVVQSL